jgi:uncharacterized protein (TIGR03437 family)
MRRIASVLLLLTPASFGYIRQVTSGNTPAVPLVRVDNSAIQFFLNTQIAPGYQSSVSGSAVPNIALDSNPQQAAHVALATWNSVSTANINFLPLKLTTAVINPNDFQATIAFGSTASDLSAVGGALAITIDSYVLGPANQGATGPVGCTSACMYPAAGDIYDSDIIINPAYTFSTTGTAGSHDLQSVLLHELGHSLSANHTGLLGASMFQFPTNRFLTTDDLAFVNSAYPPASGGATLGTIGGTVTATGGAPVPLALLTAFNTSAGVTVGGLTSPDGTYSFQAPPGNYQIYAEPLNGVVPINIYQSTQYPGIVAGSFQTTLYSGSLTVAANSTAAANITVTSGTSGIATPYVTVTPVNGSVSSAVTGGPVTVPSGQPIDLVLAGTGFDKTLTNSNFAFYGQGVTLQSVRVDSSESIGGFPLLRLTLNVAAAATPSLASFVVTSGSNTSSFSGALVIVPPTPTTTSESIVSSASGLGNGSGNGAVSPGGIYTIYDIPGAPNLGPGGSNATQYVTNGPYDAYGYLATTLAGVTVTFDGVPAPLFLSWGQQLNVQVPFEIAGKKTTQVVVNYLGSAGAPVTVPVLAVQPALYTSCGGSVCARNLADGTINSAQHPAAPGTYVELYGTGVGVLSYMFPTGQGAPAPPAGYQSTYTYTMGGAPSATAYFAGWTPTAAGLAQWDLLVPANIGTGAVSVVVTDTVSGASSQPGAKVFVQ